MMAVQGYYDGTNIRPLEALNVKLNQKVIITVLDDFVEPAPLNAKKGMRGVLAEYANSSLREKEKGAWERAVVERYGNI